MGECRERVQRALDSSEPGLKQAALLKMQLYAALGVALYSIGPSPEAKAAWANVLEFAESLENTDYQLRALWGLWNIVATGGKQRTGLSLARRFINVASKANDKVALLVGGRLIGASFHFLSPTPSAAYQAPTTVKTMMVRHETQAVVAVYHSGVFIFASQAA